MDKGYKELQRMGKGGCIADGDGADNQNSCPDHRYRGADFDHLAANVKYAGTDQTILPPYTIMNVHGAKIGFIGMTLEDTPDIVTASGASPASSSSTRFRPRTHSCPCSSARA